MLELLVDGTGVFGKVGVFVVFTVELDPRDDLDEGVSVDLAGVIQGFDVPVAALLVLDIFVGG